MYVVYLHSGGRWTRDQSFKQSEAVDAKRAAEAAAGRKDVKGVTLVRETHDTNTGDTRELAVFTELKGGAAGGMGIPEGRDRLLEPEEQPAPAAAAGGADDDAADGDDEIPDLVSGPKKAAASQALVITKLVGAIAAAAVVAGGVSWFLGLVGGYGVFETFLGRSGLPIKVFGILFFVTLLVALPNMVRWREFAQAFSVGGGTRAPRPRRKATRTAATRVAGDGEQSADEKEREQRRRERDGQHDEQTARAESAGQGAGGDADDSDDGDEAPPPSDSPALAAATKSVMTFFARCLEFLANTKSKFLSSGKLSTYDHFGTDLFLAGAAEAYSEKNGTPDQMAAIVAACVQATGRSGDKATEFAGKYEGYLMEPRYLGMFRAGREAMASFLRDEELRAKAAAGELTEQEEALLMEDESETDIGFFLENALEEWNSKEQKSAATGTVAIMFTYVAAVGGGDDDDLFKQVMNSHNRIAREALRRFDGNEIKHTGDGIMASFGQATQAVEAAAEIQRGAAIHTRNAPDMPLHVKIGVNAGEPISENDDLFGTPVQMAARVAQHAAMDQIAVSQLVRELCRGKQVEFNDLGTMNFKGFDEPVPVSEVIWRKDA